MFKKTCPARPQEATCLREAASAKAGKGEAYIVEVEGQTALRGLPERQNAADGLFQHPAKAGDILTDRLYETVCP